jgi:hypothetical protein
MHDQRGTRENAPLHASEGNQRECPFACIRGEPERMPLCMHQRGTRENAPLHAWSENAARKPWRGKCVRQSIGRALSDHNAWRIDSDTFKVSLFFCRTLVFGSWPWRAQATPQQATNSKLHDCMSDTRLFRRWHNTGGATVRTPVGRRRRDPRSRERVQAQDWDIGREHWAGIDLSPARAPVQVPMSHAMCTTTRTSEPEDRTVLARNAHSGWVTEPGARHVVATAKTS